MNTPRHALFPLLAALGACEQPSGGRCTGTVDGQEIDIGMDPEQSWFDPQDENWLLIETLVHMSYGHEGLVVHSRWNASPSQIHTGERYMDAEDYGSGGWLEPGFLSFWDVTLPSGETVPEHYPFLLEVSTVDDDWERIAGSFTYRWEDATLLTCTFDLAHY